MEMIQFLEADKEQLYGSITQAGTPEQVQGVIEKELDRLLLRYNEECKEERVRDAARYMLQAARTMSPMISSAGETKVWARTTAAAAAGGGIKWSKTTILSFAGGIIFLAGFWDWPYQPGAGFLFPLFWALYRRRSSAASCCSGQAGFL